MKEENHFGGYCNNSGEPEGEDCAIARGGEAGVRTSYI